MGLEVYTMLGYKTQPVLSNTTYDCILKSPDNTVDYICSTKSWEIVPVFELNKDFIRMKNMHRVAYIVDNSYNLYAYEDDILISIYDITDNSMRSACNKLWQFNRDYWKNFIKSNNAEEVCLVSPRDKYECMDDSTGNSFITRIAIYNKKIYLVEELITNKFSNRSNTIKGVLQFINEDKLYVEYNNNVFELEASAWIINTFIHAYITVFVANNASIKETDDYLIYDGILIYNKRSREFRLVDASASVNSTGGYFELQFSGNNSIRYVEVCGFVLMLRQKVFKITKEYIIIAVYNPETDTIYNIITVKDDVLTIETEDGAKVQLQSPIISTIQHEDQKEFTVYRIPFQKTTYNTLEDLLDNTKSNVIDLVDRSLNVKTMNILEEAQ